MLPSTHTSMRRTRFSLAPLILGWLLCIAHQASAQSTSPRAYVSLDSIIARGALAAPVTIDFVDRPVLDVITEITRQARLSFVADRALPGMSQRIRAQMRDVPAAVAIRRALAGTALQASIGPANQIVIRPIAPRADTVPQQPAVVRLNGFVRSASSNEVIRYASIVALEVTLSRESNEDGYYVLVLPAGRHTLRVRAIGYTPVDTVITLNTSAGLDLLLQPQQITLGTVSVQADRNNERGDLDPQLPDMSVVRVDMKTARLAPAVLGEVDPLRSIALLPGVATTSDASTAFTVRGGGVDQNLILLDESTIYNPAHILGFISTFNADAIDDVTLYKGAIPARFGGRLSSVVDIRQREGNARSREGSASIGLLSSRATVEGPMFRQRGSYIVSARRSYVDLLLGLSSDTAVNDAALSFYDINAKANLQLGKRGAVMISGFRGRDAFGQPDDGIAVGWGNMAGTLRWNQVFGDRLFSKVAATYSDYDYRLQFRFDQRDSARWDASITNSSLKVDETLQLTASHRLEFGAEATISRFQPGDLQPMGSNSVLVPQRVELRHGQSVAQYLGHEFDWGRFAVRYGVRHAAFDRVGEATRYRYANDAPIIYNPVTDRYEAGQLFDSVRVARGERLVRYSGFEPRASARFSLSPSASVKASYARTQQFLHLVSNTNSPSPLDVWEPVGPNVRPLLSDQFALGASQRAGEYEFTIETYYKTMRNVADFIDGADVILEPRLETIMVQGDGRAYGLELYARRTAGRTTGWISYTLARSEQRFPPPRSSGAPGGGGVNNGAWYVSPHDKTHNLSVVSAFRWKPNWTIGSTFLLASGLPVTLPESRYLVDGFLVAEYGPRNGARLPLYHRLDLNLTWQLRRGELQFGVLNAYNRFNAQSLRVRQKENEPLVAEAVQTSIFGLVPSLNYVFRF